MSESECIRKDPHPECGSSDALAVYDDGHAHCFSCGVTIQRYEGNEHMDGTGACDGGRTVATDIVSSVPPPGEAVDLPKRGLTSETCAKFGYHVIEYDGAKVQAARYIRDGAVVATKIRTRDKQFRILGDKEQRKGLPLFGQHLWRTGGKQLVITEGELDAMSMSQVQGNKWPVVSLPNGASAAVRDVRRNLEFIESFDKVVLMFDMDEPGQGAAREVAELLKPGKAHIATLPAKDANECLVQGLTRELVSAMWDAKQYRPDGILTGDAVWEVMTQDVDYSTQVDLPYPKLHDKLMGLRRGELTTLTAGSGIGKSSITRELAYWLLSKGETVGYIALEESVKRTAQGLYGIHLSKPLHLDFRNYSDLPQEERDERAEAHRATVGSGRCYLYDDWGSVDIETILSRIRYLARGCECGWIFLDHLSILVSGMETDNERRAIDMAMTQLRSLVEETGIGLIQVSHLSRPKDGKSHTEGAQVHASQLRGSASIEQLSDNLIGFERDQQGDNPDQTQVRVLKCRLTGRTGLADVLDYNHETGRLAPGIHKEKGEVGFDIEGDY